MDHDSTDNPDATDEASRKPRRGSQPDMPPQDPAQDLAKDLGSADVDPATAGPEEEDEALLLPEAAEETAVAEGTLAVGHAAIENAVRLAPTSPGVYRMLNAGNDV